MSDRVVGSPEAVATWSSDPPSRSTNLRNIGTGPKLLAATNGVLFRFGKIPKKLQFQFEDFTTKIIPKLVVYLDKLRANNIENDRSSVKNSGDL